MSRVLHAASLPQLAHVQALFISWLLIDTLLARSQRAFVTARHFVYLFSSSSTVAAASSQPR